MEGWMMSGFNAFEVAAEEAAKHEDDLTTPDLTATVITQMAGYVSACWSNMSGAGEFQSEMAHDAVESTLEWLSSQPKQALLGYATTRELIEELNARVGISDLNGEDWPRYRTVDA